MPKALWKAPCRPALSAAEVAGGYANFTVDKALYARTVLDQAL
ncbi:MAG: hypothetical protein ACLUVV_02925 [Christensenellales bacterium]